MRRWLQLAHFQVVSMMGLRTRPLNSAGTEEPKLNIGQAMRLWFLNIPNWNIKADEITGFMLGIQRRF